MTNSKYIYEKINWFYDMVMKNLEKRKKAIPFLFVAILLMVVIDQFVFSDGRPYVNKLRNELYENSIDYEAQGNIPNKQARSIPARPEVDTSFYIPEVKDMQVHEVFSLEKNPAWQKYSAYKYIDPEWTKIAIIIDDFGIRSYWAERIMQLEGPLTLSFLPFAGTTKRFSKIAFENGHELMLHMPMEPENSNLKTGKLILKSDQSPEEFEKILDDALNSFNGYVGLNNHMGSKLTQNKDAMRRLMAKLSELGLLFVDSRTIGNSVAADIAADYKLPHISRDIFLDHNEQYYYVWEQLEKLEKIAKERGYAVAIGHPKKDTYKALSEWIPTLKDKKIALVPVSMVVKNKREFNKTYINDDQPTDAIYEESPQ
jgi:polysaccharide deacetylase 2 family uncharacterized protein YibQ